MKINVTIKITHTIDGRPNDGERVQGVVTIDDNDKDKLFVNFDADVSALVTLSDIMRGR